MTGGPHTYKKPSSKNSPSSEQQCIATIYMKYGKCDYIKYSASVENNDMEAYNKKCLTTWFNCRKEGFISQVRFWLKSSYYSLSAMC
jgi:hypothetical protein